MDMERYRAFLLVNMQTESSLDHLKTYTLPFKSVKDSKIFKKNILKEVSLCSPRLHLF